MSEVKVGGDVDGYCTKCKMILGHTVLAIWAGQIKRVRCNTCKGEHAYHRGEPGTASPKVSRPRAPAAAKPKAPAAEGVSSYDELMGGKDRSSARPFSLQEKFAVGDLVKHPTFGLGVVAAARGIDKIDVAFPDSVRTLQHNKGAGPKTLAKPPPPRPVPAGEDDGKDAEEPAVPPRA
jgi:hypothetical protein